MTPHEAMLTRRTVQRFQSGPVPDEVIDRALQAATFAPNHKLTWPWRFVLVGPASRQRLADLKIALVRANRQLSPEVEASTRAKLTTPDRLVVVVQRLADDPSRREEDYATCACAIQNLSLSVHADGFHAKWGTGAVTRHPDTYELLGVDGASERVVGFVFVGQAAAVPPAAPRPAWSDVTTVLE